MKLYIPKEEDYFKSYSKELEEYIERLEHENERIYTKLDDNDKEIERLNKERNKTYENGLNYFLELQEKREENERLNNIINELFEYLKENSKQPELFESDRYYKNALDKLQELKGSNNNE